MTRKTLLLTTAMLALALAFAIALAVPQTAIAQSGGGEGMLTASGDGLAGLRGEGTIVISGNGLLWIRDHAGDASIEVTGAGVKQVLPSGWIRYAGFNGTAEVTGSKITVALSGFNIQLQATGSGKFLLRGNGTYSIGKYTGVWTAEAQVLSLP